MKTEGIIKRQNFLTALTAWGLFIMISLFSAAAVSAMPEENPGAGSDDNTLKIAATPELLPLANGWAADYRSVDKDIAATVTMLQPGTSLTSLSGEQLLLVTEEEMAGFKGDFWKMAVAKDAVVPVTGMSNPLLKTLVERGITASEYASLLTETGERSWSAITGEASQRPLHLYQVDVPSVTALLGRFTGVEPLQQKGITLLQPEALKEALRKDPGSIGFCRIGDLIDPVTGKFAEGLALVPVDKNRNGRIDFFEAIYENPEAFLRGVWIGKYPPSLCRDIYAVAGEKPKTRENVAFLQWVLAEGQDLLKARGYAGLTTSALQSDYTSLEAATPRVEPAGNAPAAGTLILLLMVVVAAGITLSLVFHYRRHREEITGDHPAVSHGIFDENSVAMLNGLFYDKTHTWAFMEAEGTVKVGIDDFLRHITGPITRVMMKEPGETVVKGEKILTLVQNGKQLNIYAPVSGTIRQQNQTLQRQATLLNESPYEAGWIYRIEPTNWARETRFLIMAEKYREWIKTEFIRLKDFLAGAIPSGEPAFAMAVLQDGGALNDQVLKEMGPDVWEDFQTRFIDPSR